MGVCIPQSTEMHQCRRSEGEALQEQKIRMWSAYLLGRKKGMDQSRFRPGLHARPLRRA